MIMPLPCSRSFTPFRIGGLLPLAAFALASFPGNAQYYKPFNASSKKLFAQAVIPAQGFSLAFDSATAVGTDSIYFHFGAMNTGSTLIDTLCQGWGSPYCYRGELPVWSGTYFRTDNAGTYSFASLLGDTLLFNFNAPIGVAQVFHEDAVQRFTCTKTGLDTMTVLGHTDSVFTANAAAEFNALLNDSLARLNDSVDLLRIAIIKVKAGMQVSITRVKEVRRTYSK